MKYIRYQHGALLLFSEQLVHDDVSRGVRFSAAGPPLSAGFVRRSQSGELVCTGRSVSMGLCADQGDTACLQQWLEGLPQETSQS